MAYSRLKMMVAALTLTVAGGAFVCAEESQTSWRLFIGDHSLPVVHVVDVQEGKVLQSFDISNYASLVASESGRAVFAVQGAGDVINVLDSGIEFEDHGDHNDIKISPPRLVDGVIEGKVPGHVVPHGGEIAVFFDREDEFRLFKESDLLKAKFESQNFSNIAAHHGAAVTLSNHILVSTPNLEAEKKPEDLPPRYGLRVLDRQGNQIGEQAVCTGLHGEATSADLVAFGCVEGVLVASSKGSEAPSVTLLKYGENFPEGRVGSLLGSKSMRFFLGNYGDDKVALIEPDSSNPFHLIDLPTRRVDFALDSANPKNAYVLTEDGNLHLIDVLKREIVKTERVTEPYSKDGHWRDPRPRLAVAGNVLAITDPRHSVVRLVDLESLKEKSTIEVAGQPFTLVAVGGSGMSH